MIYPRKVYAIRHSVTGRIYVGSSSNVDRRFLAHIYALRAHQHVVEDMQKDFDEHGEAFILTVLDTINSAEEDNKEYEWMDKYQSYVRGEGYNYKDLKRRRVVRSMRFDDEPLIEEKPKARSTPLFECGLLTENETEFIQLIRNADDPVHATLTAISFMIPFLTPAT